MFRSMLFFLTTLAPVPLFLLAITLGGFWIVSTLLYMTAFAVFCDEAFELDFSKSGSHWVAQQALPITLGAVHIILLPLAVYTLAITSLAITSKIILFIAFGLFFGMISHSNAHELIHRTNRLHRNLGKWIFISMLFGHHTSAHMLVHHPYVCTEKDPNTAKFNESFYTFLKRASVTEFIAGLRAENTRLHKQGKSSFSLQNPYWQYCIGSAVIIVITYITMGLPAAITFISLCAYAQLQMLMTDYVQHYGLLRKKLENGKYQPVSPQHSWNAPHWFSAHMTLNAPHHSDHHAAPTKLFTDLDNYRATAPQLPHSIPFMAIIALWPKKWRAMMNPRVKHWNKPG